MTGNVHDRVDILVIGAGQAGLAIAHLLKASEVRFMVLEGQSRIGDSWRQRYDSLTGREIEQRNLASAAR